MGNWEWGVEIKKSKCVQFILPSHFKNTKVETMRSIVAYSSLLAPSSPLLS